MNLAIEKGKTLLVDGPASVTVISGKVEVFGSVVSSTSKVVIREGKRLPFAAEENASFSISLGENASVEDIAENTISASWVESLEELVSFQKKPVTAMVLGTVDSGKTSFCTYLTNRLLSEKKRVAILDGDLGQSDIGPPCTVAYTFVTKPVTDLFNLEAKNAFFVGVTSPSGAIKKVTDSLTSLKKEILTKDPDFVIINTDGWVEGDDAVNYKIQLVKELSPDILFCIQQKDEMTPIINTLETSKIVVVDSPSAIRQRSREKRRNLRELGYVKYLRNAKMQSLPSSWLKIEENELLNLGKTHETTRRAEKIYGLLGMKPLHFVELKDKICIVIGRGRWINRDALQKVEEFSSKKVTVIRKGEEEGLLAGLYDANRGFLGIGVLHEVDYARKALKILTPVSEEISVLSFGKVKLDKNMKEIPIFTEDTQSDFATFKKLF